MSNTDDKPRFDHDCKHCVFLGGYKGQYCGAPPRHYDLYVCRSPDEETRRVMGDTVIARYGSSDQYVSGDRKVLENAGHTDGPLGEAMRRADEYFKKEEATMNEDGSDWTAPWLRHWPEKPTELRSMRKYVNRHGLHHGVIACCIKVHSLGLPQIDREKMYAMLGAGAEPLMYSGGKEVLDAFNEEQKDAEIIYGGRSSGWLELVYPRVSHHAVRGYSPEDAEADEGLPELVDIVWAFDHAVQDAIRVALAWVRPRTVREGRIVIEDTAKCPVCGGRGWLFFPCGDTVDRLCPCGECGQYKDHREALDAALLAIRTPARVQHDGAELIEVASMVAKRWVNQGGAYSDFLKSVTLLMEATVKK